VFVLQTRSVSAGTTAQAPVAIQTERETASPAVAEASATAGDPSAAGMPPSADVKPPEAPAVSQPAAAAQPAPEAGRYSLLVGSFRQNSEAGTLVEQLRALGYRARTGRFESADRGTWHQVSVGPYTDLERARQDEARVRRLPGYADAHLITQ
jgi:cell division septation protein DedD